MQATGRPEERGAETKHAAVTGDFPVSPVGTVGRDADNRLVQVLTAHRTVELRIAEAEDPARNSQDLWMRF